MTPDPSGLAPPAERRLIESARQQAAQAAPAIPPPDSFPGYQLHREIHRGGQGVVYQATQKSTGRKVAIKVIRQGPFAGTHDRARFEREVRVLAQLQHPSIVAIHDSGEAAGLYYFVMDYIAGVALDQHMDTHGRDVEASLRLFVSIAQAVSFAHLKGVIHRDLKPSNIRIDSEGEPHVLDFGLAKLSAEQNPASAASMTATGQFLGSLPWASPEQAEGAPDKIDMRSDVYSLGVILFHMLTGKFPYEMAGSMRNALDTILNTQPTRPSTIRRQINDEVETIILKCLSKEADRRYQTAGELARDVERYLQGEPIQAKGDSGWYVLSKTLRRYRVHARIGLAALICVVALAGTMSVLYVKSRNDVAAAWRLAVLEVTHRGLAEEAHERTRRRAEMAEQSLAFMREFMRPPADSSQLSQALQEMLDRAAASAGQRFVEDPALQAAVRKTLGESYAALGLPTQRDQQFAAAERLLLDELAKARMTSDWASQQAQWRSHLVDLYESWGRPDEAAKYR